MSLHVTIGNSVGRHYEGDVWVESGKTWTIKNGIKRDQERAESYREELPKRIQRLVDDYESYIKNSLESVEKHKENLMLLESINLDDIMAEYETQGDKMVKILYILVLTVAVLN